MTPEVGATKLRNGTWDVKALDKRTFLPLNGRRDPHRNCPTWGCVPQSLNRHGPTAQKILRAIRVRDQHVSTTQTRKEHNIPRSSKPNWGAQKGNEPFVWHVLDANGSGRAYKITLKSNGKPLQVKNVTAGRRTTYLDATGRPRKCSSGSSSTPCPKDADMDKNVFRAVRPLQELEKMMQAGAVQSRWLDSLWTRIEISRTSSHSGAAG